MHKNVSKEFKVHWRNILKAGKSNLACSQQFVPGSSACKSQSCILNLEDKGLHCCSLITYRFARHWQTSLWCLEYKVKALSTLLSMFERSLCQGHTMYRSNFPAVADVCALTAHVYSLVCAHMLPLVATKSITSRLKLTVMFIFVKPLK